MELHIFREAKTRTPGKKIQALFELVVEREGRTEHPGDVNLVFTTDQKIRVLNRKYRRKDKPTDVLSFTLDETAREGETYGEIYISAPTARRQAEQNGLNIVDEYLRLFCHGLLHLFGYDHKKASEAAHMSERENAYLAGI
ncbi:MAG TPA: rRNA maturation RNase YbeY [Candidatus Acidoferrum sp.]|nr:rRNA maturation RNase YbeY [Candidatus Acidoferrum sp.]